MASLKKITLSLFLILSFHPLAFSAHCIDVLNSIQEVAKDRDGRFIFKDHVIIRNSCPVTQKDISVSVVFKSSEGLPAGVHTSRVKNYLLRNDVFEFQYTKIFPKNITPVDWIYDFTSWDEPNIY